jgi:hypothetical protein
VAGSCEGSNEPSGSMKDGKFLYQLNDYQRLKKYIVSWNYVKLGDGHCVSDALYPICTEQQNSICHIPM